MNKVMFNSELPSVFAGKAPFADAALSKSYVHFYNLANNNGNKMYFASAEDYENGNITGHWIPHNETWLPITEQAPVSFIFNKLDCFDKDHARVLASLQEKKIPIYGDLDMSEFVSDKWKCYEKFHDSFSLTKQIEKDEETIEQQIHDFFDQMDSFYHEHNNAVILKPVSGWQARGIHLITREADGNLQLRYLFGQPINDPELVKHILKLFAHVPYIIQAYVDTKSGIPEIGLGDVAFHDVRFVFYIKEPGMAQFVQLYLKTPEGMIYYPIDQFPQEAFRVMEPVASQMAQMFPYGVFSVDVMRDKGGSWYLTELNDQIGFNINWERTSDIKNVTHLMQTFLDDMDRIQTLLK